MQKKQYIPKDYNVGKTILNVLWFTNTMSTKCGHISIYMKMARPSII